jgi:hypothetical protein
VALATERRSAVTELTVEFGGLRATLAVPGEEAAWEALRLVSRLSSYRGRDEEGRAVTNGTKSRLSSSSPVVRSDEKRGNQAERIREVVRPILADGRGHRRLELVEVVKAAGLPQTQLDGALKGHFYKYENAEGAPCYRDKSVDPPWGHTERPEWAEHSLEPDPRPNGIPKIGLNGRDV